MKTLWFLVLIGLLFEALPNLALANTDSTRYIAYCVPSTQLNQLGKFYENQLEASLASTYNSPDVNIRFIKTSPIELGRISVISEIFESGLTYSDFNGTPVLSGDIIAKPCRAVIPISITIRSTGTDGNRIQTSSRNQITVTGQMAVRSSRSSNSGIFIKKDFYHYP